MTSGKTKLVFFGNERLVSGLSNSDTPVLRMLIDQGYDIVAVVAHHSDTRSRNGRPLEVAQVTSEHGIPLLTPEKPTDIYDQLARYGAEAAVLVAYGRIIPQRVIDLFPRGIINVHPSLLPDYRGPTPIESPILNGDSESGVSVMNLTAKMDAGPIYVQQRFTIAPTDNKFSIYDKAAQLSTTLLAESLPHILDGSLTATPQDDSSATYCQLIDKSDSRLDYSKPAEQLEREIRAYLGWPQSRITIGSVELVVTAAHIVDQTGVPGEYVSTNDELIVFTGKQALSIDRLKPAGKKEMPVQAFLTGYRHKL